MIRTQRAEERAEMAKIRAECDELRTVVTQQQRFMEQLDSRDRERNLIITGLPEEEAFDGAVNDQGKCRKVMEVIGAEGVSLQPILQTDTTHTVVVTSPGLRQYRSY